MHSEVGGAAFCTADFQVCRLASRSAGQTRRPSATLALPTHLTTTSGCAPSSPPRRERTKSASAGSNHRMSLPSSCGSIRCWQRQSAPPRANWQNLIPRSPPKMQAQNRCFKPQRTQKTQRNWKSFSLDLEILAVKSSRFRLSRPLLCLPSFQLSAFFISAFAFPPPLASHEAWPHCRRGNMSGSVSQFVGNSVKIVSNSRPSGRAYSRGAWRVRYAWRPAGPRAGGSKLGPAARRPPANRTARGGPEWPKRVVTTRPTGRTARNCPKTGLAQRIRRFAQPTDSAEVAYVITIY